MKVRISQKFIRHLYNLFLEVLKSFNHFSFRWSFFFLINLMEFCVCFRYESFCQLCILQISISL